MLLARQPQVLAAIDRYYAGGRAVPERERPPRPPRRRRSRSPRRKVEPRGGPESGAWRAATDYDRPLARAHAEAGMREDGRRNSTRHAPPPPRPVNPRQSPLPHPTPHPTLVCAVRSPTRVATRSRASVATRAAVRLTHSSNSATGSRGHTGRPSIRMRRRGTATTRTSCQRASLQALYGTRVVIVARADRSSPAVV